MKIMRMQLFCLCIAGIALLCSCNNSSDPAVDGDTETAIDGDAIMDADEPDNDIIDDDIMDDDIMMWNLRILMNRMPSRWMKIPMKAWMAMRIQISLMIWRWILLTMQI